MTMRAVLLAFGAWALAPGVGLAQAPSNDPSAAVTDPIWITKPLTEDYQRYHPARLRDVQGFTTLSCVVQPNGRLADCYVRAQQPEGPEFAEAALKVAKIFRMKPQDKWGRPVAGRPVNIPIRWPGW